MLWRKRFPLTTLSKSNNSGGSSGGDSAREEVNTRFNDENFSVGITHIVALVASKAPQHNTSNFSVMNLYQSVGVLEAELELQLKGGGETTGQILCWG